MTRRSFADAVADHDVTEALTVSQLVLVAVGAYLLLRILRGVRR